MRTSDCSPRSPGWVVLVAFVLALAACTGQQPQPATQQPAAPPATSAAEPTQPPAAETEQTPVVVIQGADPVTMDPHKSGSITEFSILNNIFAPLLTKDAEGNLQPGVATEWTRIDDTTWEFKIREGLKAHDGEVIDANDVAYSFNRVVDPATGAKAHLLWVMGNFRGERAEAVDNTTVRLYTDGLSPTVQDFMWQWFILPEDYYTSHSLEELELRPMGTGPYKFVEWRKGEHVLIEANEDFYAGAPEVKQILWRTVPEATSRIAELNTGNADVIVDVPPDLREQIDPNFAKLITAQSLRRMYIGIVGYNEPALQDKRVRQALNYAVDIQRIVDNLLNGEGERTSSFASPPYIDPDLPPYPYDPERARELLAEAGLEDRDGDGFVDYEDGRRLELTLQTSNGAYIKDVEVSQAIAADLTAAGIMTEVEPMEWTTYMGQASTATMTGDLWFLGADGGYSCQADLSDWVSHTEWKPGKLTDPTADAIFEELSQTFDQGERQELCYKLQAALYDFAPQIFMYNQVSAYGVSNRLDWTPHPTERIFMYGAEFVE